VRVPDCRSRKNPPDAVGLTSFRYRSSRYRPLGSDTSALGRIIQLDDALDYEEFLFVQALVKEAGQGTEKKNPHS